LAAAELHSRPILDGKGVGKNRVKMLLDWKCLAVRSADEEQWKMTTAGWLCFPAKQG
jgi:hypothetical protein